MKQTLPWYKRCPSDWRQGTRKHEEFASFELRGFYSECLDAMWELQGELPKDTKALAMLLGTNPRMVRALMPKLLALGKFTESATGYYNARMLSDIGAEIPAPYQARVEIEPVSKIQNSSMFSTRDLDTEEDTDKKEQKSETSSDVFALQGDEPKTKARKAYSSDFELFWKAYPDTTNTSKANAAKQWGRLDAADKTQAMAALPAFAALQAAAVKSGQSKALHPERYLSQRRFETIGAPQPDSEKLWFEDPEKLAIVTLDQWRGSIAKHANGVWPIEKLGYWPGHRLCVVPTELIKELHLADKYDSAGYAKGAWKKQQDQKHGADH